MIRRTDNLIEDTCNGHIVCGFVFDCKEFSNQEIFFTNIWNTFFLIIYTSKYFFNKLACSRALPQFISLFS